MPPPTDIPSPPQELIRIPSTEMPPPPKKPKQTALRRRRTSPVTELIDISYKQLALFFQISSPDIKKSQLGEDECHTPTSNESNSSAAMEGQCPPPPPAKLRPHMRCKRSLLKEERFVEVEMEELQSLFRPKGSPSGELAAERESMGRKKRRVMC